MLAYQIQQHTTYTACIYIHVYMMAGRKLALRSERTESESWTPYKLSPLMCGT